MKTIVLQVLRKAFPNHDDILTDGLSRLITWFVFVSAVMLMLPLLLTCNSISFIDFTETGQIGDTIGGILGPFVALLAAFLTFLAFWIQYRANNLQRDIAERQLNLSTQQNDMVAKQTEIAEKQMEMAKEQEKKYAIERFENTLHQMLDVYSRNSEAVRAGELSGKEAFEELAAEFVFIYRVLHQMLNELSKSKDYKKIVDDNQKRAVDLYLRILDSDNKKRLLFLMNLSYALFFTGAYTKNKVSLQSDLVGSILENELFWRIKDMLFTKSLTNTYKSKLMALGRTDIVSYSAPYEMACGHSSALGHYYRQMLQIVRFVSETPGKMLTEEQKYEYVKMLRSQLCDAYYEYYRPPMPPYDSP